MTKEKDPCPECGHPKNVKSPRCIRCTRTNWKDRTNNWEHRKQAVKNQLKNELTGGTPQPVTCGLDNWVFQDNRAYLLHLKGNKHINPQHIEQLHWNSQAWEIIPAFQTPETAKKFHPYKTPPGKF